MPTDHPLVNRNCLLERFNSKGGWTYVRVPEIPMSRDMPFGWKIVRGSIDTYELKACKLMPMGDGSLFLPVKKEIRKVIKKEAGDLVKLTLYPDDTSIDIPNEIWECLREEPEALEAFRTLNNSKRKYYMDWIYKAKREETKVERIASMITELCSV